MILRDEWSAIIPAGARMPFKTSADFFYIDEITTVATNASAKIDASLNRGRFARIGAGHSLQGIVGNSDVRQLDFYNQTGNEVFVRVIYGNGVANFMGEVTIQNAAISLSAATIAAINPPAVNDAAGWEEVNNEIKTFTGCTGITVVNDGGLPITVQGKALPVGQSVEWSANGRSDTVGPVVVDATGSHANVIHVGGLIS